MIDEDLRELLAIPRPRTRGECRAGDARPCPWFACEHHLVLEVIPTTSPRRYANALAIARPGGRNVLPGAAVDEATLDAFIDDAIARLHELPDTCAEDVRERGGCTAAELAELAGVTPGRLRQIERAALARARRRSGDGA